MALRAFDEHEPQTLPTLAGAPALMARYLLRRASGLVLTLLLASLLVFVALDLLPGNAAQLLMGPDADPAAVAALAEQLGLNRSAAARYGAWLWGLLRGDLGLSHVYASPVAALIAERLAVTVPLALLAMALATALALAAGLYAAARHGGAGDAAVLGLTQLGIAVPNFWLAILLVLLFAVKLQWFAAGGFPGWRAAEGGGIGAALQALALPALSLALVQAAILARVTRTALLEVLGEDFMRTAYAKGLSRRAALLRHALPNALLPVLTVMGLQFASLLAGTLVVENLFVLPGLGRLVFQAVENRDLLLLRNAVLLLVAMVMTVNFVVELLAAALDPRLRREPGT